MNHKHVICVLPALLLMTFLNPACLFSDGGFVTTSESIALSSDQRAVIIVNGDRISITYSTSYTGDGSDFGWILPVPVIPDKEDVFESEEMMFTLLDRITAPTIVRSDGCFPAGTPVRTPDGYRLIESLARGDEVFGYNFDELKWTVVQVGSSPVKVDFEGNLYELELGASVLRVTGNHPVLVIRGAMLHLRPHPEDLPIDEPVKNDSGRWVAVRDLRIGDVVASERDGEALVRGITNEWIHCDVYNLKVDQTQNYAIGSAGILVHNKGSADTKESLVAVYAQLDLDHYEVTILKSGSGRALGDWLNTNSYPIPRESAGILDYYIQKDWSFVAVRIRPDIEGYSENAFLPPLTIRYRANEVVFPMKISALSSDKPIKVVLYLIGDSTYASSNYPTKKLRYSESRLIGDDSGEYLEDRIRTMVSRKDQASVLIWAGVIKKGRLPIDSHDFYYDEESGIEADTDQMEVIDRSYENAVGLILGEFDIDSVIHLTRIETIQLPTIDTEDTHLIEDRGNQEFNIFSSDDDFLLFGIIVVVVFSFVFIRILAGLVGWVYFLIHMITREISPDHLERPHRSGLMGIAGPLTHFRLSSLDTALDYHEHSRISLNFQLTIALCYFTLLGVGLLIDIVFISYITISFTLAFLLAWILALISIVSSLIASKNVKKGKPYRYPFSIQFIRPA